MYIFVIVVEYNECIDLFMVVFLWYLFLIYLRLNFFFLGRGECIYMFVFERESS